MELVELAVISEFVWTKLLLPDETQVPPKQRSVH
jgi:hypothetical protein